jgi:catechol 2,3-dioxygenase-like lactoylglutathione lyase family enzyme
MKGTVMIRALAHVCYISSDLERAIAFYRDKLGLTPAFDFRDDKGKRTGIYIHIGGRSFIEIFQGKVGPRAEGQTYGHLCLEVDDFDKAVADLKAKGVEVGGVLLACDHSWQAWIKDPDGNAIELHGYTPESRQAPWLK